MVKRAASSSWTALHSSRRCSGRHGGPREVGKNHARLVSSLGRRPSNPRLVDLLSGPPHTPALKVCVTGFTLLQAGSTAKKAVASEMRPYLHQLERSSVPLRGHGASGLDAKTASCNIRAERLIGRNAVISPGLTRDLTILQA
jgi:hypothetical protein